ncbi:MAG: hypothetical protein LBE71_05255 [Dysgonamonadaceae bacterium]|nr:hypothetical protein [Dysgonamonadaceae bacterium]
MLHALVIASRDSGAAIRKKEHHCEAKPKQSRRKNRNAPNASTAPRSITLDRKLTVVSPF